MSENFQVDSRIITYLIITQGKSFIPRLKDDMFLKRKISVSTYCSTRLDLLFSTEQADRWLQLKRSWPDSAVTELNDGPYLAHLRATHIALLLMVLTKKCRDINLSIEADTFIEKYLEENNASMIKNLIELYNRALAAPVDGVLAIAQAMASYLCQNQCSQETILDFGRQLYGAVDSYSADFKKVKIV